MSGYVGIVVRCAVCGHRKQPHGRAAPRGGNLCERLGPDADNQCPGYDVAPAVGCLWPGETCEDFGFPHCHDGAILAARDASRAPETIADPPCVFVYGHDKKSGGVKGSTCGRSPELHCPFFPSEAHDCKPNSVHGHLYHRASKYASRAPGEGSGS